MSVFVLLSFETVIKTRDLPSGNQLWQYFAISDSNTSSSFPPPSTVFSYRSYCPFRSELKIMCFPSGDQHGYLADPGPDVSRDLTPRDTSYSQMSDSKYMMFTCRS